MTIRDIVFNARIALGEWPFPHRAIERLRPEVRNRLTLRDTRIVIEGFPRSANSFAYHAFLYAQEKNWGGHIAHHVHVPSQFKVANRYGVPVLILIRNPVDTTVSLRTRHTHLSSKGVLCGYIRYYSSLKKHIEDFVFGSFCTATSSFGKLIEVVNKKYNKNFEVFEHNEEKELKIMDIVKKSNKKSGLRENQVGVPSEEKDEVKDKYRQEVKSCGRLVKKAERIFCEVENRSI